MTTISRTIPEGLDLVVAQDGITVRKVWLTWKILPLAGFAVLIGGVLLFTVWALVYSCRLYQRVGHADETTGG